MAEALFGQLCAQRGLTDVTALSAGLYAGEAGAVSPHVRALLNEERVTLARLRSRPLSRRMVETADIVVAMTQAHARQIVGRYPSARGKTRTLLSFTGDSSDVSDPFGGSLQTYRACFDTMRPALHELADSLAEATTK